MLDEVRAALPGAARGARPRGRLGGAARRDGARRERGRARRARGGARSSTTRSTSSTRRARRASRRARRSRTTTSSTTATSSAQTLRYTERGPRLRPGAVLPLLRHGASATSPARRTAPAWSSRASRSTRSPSSRPSQAERCTSLYGVPTMFIARARAPALRGVRPLEPAHRASWPARPARSR